jgi:predicted RNase H-like HicB family nuclease
MKEITFIVQEADEGGFYAESVGAGIFAEGDTIDDLKENIKGGIDCYFLSHEDKPAFIHLHFLRMKFLRFEDSKKYFR